MYDASCEARNTYACAISAGWAGRPMGACLPNSAVSGSVAGISGVHTGPGATALTRMPRSISICASPCVKVTMAPFVVA
ncbi:hypothetical protein STENM223S_11005 [Streptomyces tendae]